MIESGHTVHEEPGFPGIPRGLNGEFSHEPNIF
jgi:hypothetical protein